MKISNIFSFINPIGDGLSTFFVLLLISLSILTVIWLMMSAKEKNWEKNWNGKHSNGNASLDSEHGSVHELAEAVATKAEQVAEIMPSMLLIIGLLGTFVGLGIALNSASEVLVSANSSGMDSAMTNLMSLMEGLGAKFKTSTWGLLCFIALNIIFNVFGFKEKRLTWSIQKARQEAERKNLKTAELEQEKHDNLLKYIIGFNKQSQENNANLLNFLGRYASSNKAHQELLNNNFQAQLELSKANLTTAQALEKQSKQNNEELINSLKIQNQQIVETLHQGFKKHIDQIQKDSNHHINELKNIVTSNQAIQKASEITTAELKTVVKSLTEGFKENSQQLQDGSHKSLIELKKIAEYNQQTQHAMQDFVDKTISSMSSIGESADKMGQAAQAVGTSATGLNGVVQNLKSELEQVMSMIKEDLRPLQNPRPTNSRNMLHHIPAVLA